MTYNNLYYTYFYILISFHNRANSMFGLKILYFIVIQLFVPETNDTTTFNNYELISHIFHFDTDITALIAMTNG